MLEYTSNIVTANGINLHYYRTGGNKPLMVLAHGVTDDGLCWTPLAEKLAVEFDLIMVDARGHGKSEAPKSGYTMNDLANDLAALVQVVCKEKPILLGHSLGAITVLSMAALFPDLPRAIVLEDPPTFWDFKGSDPGEHGTHNDMLNWIMGNKRKTHAELLTEVRTNNPGWAEGEIEPWINSKHRYSPNIGAITNIPEVVNLDYPNLLNSVRCPTLFITADPDKGSICTAGDTERLKALIKGLTAAHIPNAGHNIHRDQFEPYLKVVKQFLAGLPK
jgi:N-formylmaleamate deformylase